MATTQETDVKELPPIFADCCQDDFPNMPPQPFVSGAHVYAIDGRICVRTLAGDRPESDVRKPPADKLPWPMTEPAKSYELPDVGEGTIVCEECRGTGNLVSDDADPWECDDCGGKGFYGDPAGVAVGPIFLARRFVALLRRHGVKRVWPTTAPGNSRGKRRKDCGCAYFVGDGFEGLLMGTTEPAAVA